MTCSHRVRHLARLRLVASDPTVSPSHLTVATHPGPVLVRAGSAVIPSFGVLASEKRKVRVTELDPAVTREFYEISNRRRKLQVEAIEFGTFLKTYIARRVRQDNSPPPRKPSIWYD